MLNRRKKGIVEENPHRYEIIDTETGEKVATPSFILTPTGEEMHLLSDVHHFSSLGLGIYYWGNIDNVPGAIGPKHTDVIRSMALYYILDRGLAKLARGFPLAGSRAHDLRYIAQHALSLAETLEQEEEKAKPEKQASQSVV